MNLPLPHPTSKKKVVIQQTTNMTTTMANSAVAPSSVNNNSILQKKLLLGSTKTSKQLYRSSQQPTGVSSKKTKTAAATDYNRVFNATTGGGGHINALPNPMNSNKKTTREIAALEFLLNIPLEAERSIVRAGLGDDVANNNSTTYSYNIGEDEKRELTSSLLQEEEEVNRQLLETPTDNCGGWWEKLILKDRGFFFAENQRIKRRERFELETGVLEHPLFETNDDNKLTVVSMEEGALQKNNNFKKNPTPTVIPNINGSLFNNKLPKSSSSSSLVVAAATTSIPQQPPGRRLEGIEFTPVSIQPDVLKRKTNKFRDIGVNATVREWEKELITKKTHFTTTSHLYQSSSTSNATSLTGGRMFFSSKGSYPMSTFSILSYQAKREEEIRLQKKIESEGGGGTRFNLDYIQSYRDWRGISYRELLKRDKVKRNKAFKRMLRESSRKSKRQLLKKRMNRRKKRGSRMNNRRRNSKDVDFDDSDDDSDIDDDDAAREEEKEEDLLSSGNDESGRSKISTDDSGDSDDDVSTSSSSEESTFYQPGFLDDPSMVQGRHRHVMVGDHITGCVVSSTIHYVQPADLKADLNKQFQQRFDQWEPTKSQRKYIGAKVVNGIYTLMDPTESHPIQEKSKSSNNHSSSNQESSHVLTTSTTTTKVLPTKDNTMTDTLQTTSSTTTIKTPSSIIATDKTNTSTNNAPTTAAPTILHIPRSLTLSKIRSLKQKTLLAFCVVRHPANSKLEVSTLALAFCYFERLCLQCRVDKTNRRLSFAACLLIAAKINEANVAIAHHNHNHDKDDDHEGGSNRGGGWGKGFRNTKKDSDEVMSGSSKNIPSVLQPFYKPTKKHGTIFASLLEFFTHEWSLSIKSLFAAEWGVFAVRSIVVI